MELLLFSRGVTHTTASPCTAMSPGFTLSLDMQMEYRTVSALTCVKGTGCGDASTQRVQPRPKSIGGLGGADSPLSCPALECLGPYSILCQKDLQLEHTLPSILGCDVVVMEDTIYMPFYCSPHNAQQNQKSNHGNRQSGRHAPPSIGPREPLWKSPYQTLLQFKFAPYQITNKFLPLSDPRCKWALPLYVIHMLKNTRKYRTRTRPVQVTHKGPRGLWDRHLSLSVFLQDICLLPCDTPKPLYCATSLD